MTPRPVRFPLHSGMEERAEPYLATRAQEVSATLTRRERQILGLLRAASTVLGVPAMLSRRDLRASTAKMDALYWAGLVNGCGTPDHRGCGNTPDSSFWWLTARGKQIAELAGIEPPPKAHP
jgi:hypothetical protein